MKTYSEDELKSILKKHILWVYGNQNGECADLHGADLSGADLHGVDLSGAYLRGANLSGAYLRGADLSKANLSGADLSEADLYGANLREADLSKANLSGADLSEADFREANLSEADFREANLSCADLRGANLSCTILYQANLSQAKLSGAKLICIKYNENTSFFLLQCPEEGLFIAYKKVKERIVKLEIPADAKRSSATSYKCRCSKARVLGIYDFNRNLLDETEIVNENYGTTVYRVGEMVYPDSFDEDRWNECSNGIHFFINFDMAVRY